MVLAIDAPQRMPFPDDIPDSDEGDEEREAPVPRRETQLSRLYEERRPHEFKKFSREVKQTRAAIDNAFANNTPLEGEEILEIYRALKMNVVRIARTYYNGATAALPGNETAGNNARDRFNSLDAVDRRAQLDFFSDWDHRDKVRILLCSGKIFELLRERLIDDPHCIEVKEEPLSPGSVFPPETTTREKRAAQRILSFMRPVRFTTESSGNVLSFNIREPKEVLLLCELALGFARVLQGGSLTYQLRSIDVGTPIAGREGEDFAVETFLEEDEPQWMVTCDVYCTVFPALLCSQRVGSRPILPLEKATVIGNDGPRVELDLQPRRYLAFEEDAADGEASGRRDLSRDPYAVPKNIVTRRVVHEL